jgi:hypothetical protein
MRRHGWIAALLVALVAAARGPAGEPAHGEPCGPCFLDRVAPAGGWFPYGGGLLCWWDPDCFPRCGGPDDYCRKNLPCVCWPRCPTCSLAPAAVPPPPVHVTGKHPSGSDHAPAPAAVAAPAVRATVSPGPSAPSRGRSPYSANP